MPPASLSQEATLRKILRVQTEGSRRVSRGSEFYNLDAILSVGYRVNSTQATQFRIWATQTLREFVIKAQSVGACTPASLPANIPQAASMSLPPL